MLPASKNTLSKLGKRLAAGTPADGDRELYAAMLDAYDQVQVDLVETLRGSGWGDDMPPLAVHGRTKSRDTLIEKLRRSPDVQLPYVRDVAGVRIVGDVTLTQQTAIGGGLVARYGGKLIDRRAEPQAGYRALHAALILAGLPVEVQIRTKLQHLWAEVFERVADQWGRQIRYGGSPDLPRDGEWPDLDVRTQTVAQLQLMGVEHIDAVEVLRDCGTASPKLDEVIMDLERILHDLMRSMDRGTAVPPAGPMLEKP